MPITSLQSDQPGKGTSYNLGDHVPHSLVLRHRLWYWPYVLRSAIGSSWEKANILHQYLSVLHLHASECVGEECGYPRRVSPDCRTSCVCTYVQCGRQYC